MFAVTQITGVGVFDDEIHQGVAAAGRPGLRAQRFSQLPRRGFVDPHQRRFDQIPLVHAQRQRQLHGLHGVVAAIGVARKIRLANPGDDHLQIAPVGHSGGQREEQKVAAWNERIGQAALLHLERGVARQ